MISHLSYTLWGASGCGKSTLIKSILSLVKIDMGRISIDGDNVKIGYMPQFTGLFYDLTIEENLRFFAFIYEMREKLFLKRVSYLAKILDISDFKR